MNREPLETDKNKLCRASMEQTSTEASWVTPVRGGRDLSQGADTRDKTCSCNGHEETRSAEHHSKVFGATGREKLPLIDTGRLWMERTWEREDQEFSVGRVKLELFT